jgi:Rieske Fe-S protein
MTDHDPSAPARADSEDPEAESLYRVRKALNDFPIRASEEDAVTRREFVRYLALGSGGLAIGTAGIAALASLRRPAAREPMEVVALDDVDVGGTHLFSYPTDDDPAILLRPTPEDVLAYSQRCTHLACVVYYAHDDGELVCPCHNGHFDAADGRVLAGPPERPLNMIDLEIRDGVVWALGGGGH